MHFVYNTEGLSVASASSVGIRVLIFSCLPNFIFLQYFLCVFFFHVCVLPPFRCWETVVLNESVWVWGEKGEQLVGVLELCNTLALNFKV